MGLFDFLKKKHVDNTYHSGSPEAKQHWAQYQKFQDAQNRVLGQPTGLYSHFAAPYEQAGKLTAHTIHSREAPYRHDGFNSLAAKLSAGEVAALSAQEPDRFDNLHTNLSEMHQRLEHDFTKQNHNARHQAVAAEFLAKLPQAEAIKATAAFADLMADKEQFNEMTSALGLGEQSRNYETALKNLRSADGFREGFEQAREDGNRYLELRLGLKRNSLEGSILGDPGILYTSGQYYQKPYETTYAPFRDGSRDSQDYGNGSHLMMIRTTLDIAEGSEQVPTKHAHLSLNEYFTARQKDMARPEGERTRERPELEGPER